ncbi:4-hydroxythreonine-4-phosphate dehydrogenase PdxA [soil metagenome]
MSHDQEGRIKVGISIGDVSGIGPEVIIKTFMDTRMMQVCTPVIYGSGKAISFHRKALNIQEFTYNTVRNIKEVIPRKLNLINSWEEEIKIEIGKPSTLTGSYALKALQDTITDLIAGNIDVLVTAPIDKHSIQVEGEEFTGHTGYLAKSFNVEDHLMFLIADGLRVALVTEHVPVSKIASLITKENILRKLQVMHRSLKRDFGVRKPRIAVLGLNPHAGDHGVIGNEDLEIIAPALKEANDKGIMAYGPYSADGMFGSGLYHKFDAVLAMYHDQGLIPFKTLAFDSGVNFTAGLPFVRTSPDHGTAYDIAGKGIANEESFRQAIYLACDIFLKRQEFDEINEKPLAFSKLHGDR